MFRRLVFALQALLLVGMISCGSFKPRSPANPCDPDVDDCDPLVEALTPELMRDIIKSTLDRLLVNPTYNDRLAEGFAYIPDVDSVGRARPGFFDAWNKTREVDFMLTLLSASVQQFEITFGEYADTGELTGNEARYRAEYTIDVTFNDGTSEQYGALSIWDLEGGDRNSWTIRTWTDVRALNVSVRGTIGMLKAVISGS